MISAQKSLTQIEWVCQLADHMVANGNRRVNVFQVKLEWFNFAQDLHFARLRNSFNRTSFAIYSESHFMS